MLPSRFIVTVVAICALLALGVPVKADPRSSKYCVGLVDRFQQVGVAGTITIGSDSQSVAAGSCAIFTLPTGGVVLVHADAYGYIDPYQSVQLPDHKGIPTVNVLITGIL